MDSTYNPQNDHWICFLEADDNDEDENDEEDSDEANEGVGGRGDGRFPIPRDAVTNGNGDTTTVSRCTNFDTF